MKHFNDVTLHEIYRYLNDKDIAKLIPLAKIFYQAYLYGLAIKLRQAQCTEQQIQLLITKQVLNKNIASCIISIILQHEPRKNIHDLLILLQDSACNIAARTNLIWENAEAPAQLLPLVKSNAAAVMLYFKLTEPVSVQQDLPDYYASILKKTGNETQKQQLLWLLANNFINTETFEKYHLNICSALSSNLIHLLANKIISHADLRFDFLPLLCEQHAAKLLENKRISAAQIESIPYHFRKIAISTQHGYTLFNQTLISLAPAALVDHQAQALFTEEADYSTNHDTHSHTFTIKPNRLASLFKQITDLIKSNAGHELINYLTGLNMNKLEKE